MGCQQLVVKSSILQNFKRWKRQISSNLGVLRLFKTQEEDECFGRFWLQHKCHFCVSMKTCRKHSNVYIRIYIYSIYTYGIYIYTSAKFCKTDFEHLRKSDFWLVSFFLFRYPLLHLHKFQQTPVECSEPSVRCRVLNEYIRAPINRIVVDWSPYNPGKHSAKEHQVGVKKPGILHGSIVCFFFCLVCSNFWIYQFWGLQGHESTWATGTHTTFGNTTGFLLCSAPRGEMFRESDVLWILAGIYSLQIVPRFCMFFFLMSEMLIDKSCVFLMKSSLRHTDSSVVRDFVNHVWCRTKTVWRKQ